MPSNRCQARAPLIRSVPKGLCERRIDRRRTWWEEASTGSKTGQATELPSSGTGVPARETLAREAVIEFVVMRDENNRRAGRVSVRHLDEGVGQSVRGTGYAGRACTGYFRIRKL